MTKRTILIFALAVAVVGTIIGLREWNREPEKASDKVEVASISAQRLLSEFASDEAAATAKYVGKQEQAIRVNGVIRSLDNVEGGTVNVVLRTDDEMASVICEFAGADVPKEWKAGDTVSLKGICTGYLMDVVLNRCTPVAQ